MGSEWVSGMAAEGMGRSSRKGPNTADLPLSLSLSLGLATKPTSPVNPSISHSLN